MKRVNENGIRQRKVDRHLCRDSFYDFRAIAHHFDYCCIDCFDFTIHFLGLVYMIDTNTVKETAIEAIREASILEFATSSFDETHMLETAELLSGVPFFLIQEVYQKHYRE